MSETYKFIFINGICSALSNLKASIEVIKTQNRELVKTKSFDDGRISDCRLHDA